MIADLLHIAAVFGVFVAIIAAIALLIVGGAWMYGRLVDEELPLWLDPTQDTEPVRLLRPIDLPLDRDE